VQTGFFFVKLKRLAPKSTGDSAVAILQEAFGDDRPYPVLAVELRRENGSDTTLYHMPTQNNELGCFSSEHFEFAGKV